MKQIIFSFFFLLLINFVFGQSSSPTNTNSNSMSTSFSNSVTASWSMSLSNTITVTPTWSISMSNTVTVSTSLSWTQTASMSNTGSGSVSTSMSYTITRSNSKIHYYAPEGLVNTCSNERSWICLSWSPNVGGVTYALYSLTFKLVSENAIYSVPNIQEPRFVLTDLQPGSEYVVSVQGSIGNIVSPPSPYYPFKTAPDFRDGVNSIACSMTASSTVVCTWNNGQNLYSKIRAKLYCDTKTGVISSMGVSDGLTTTTLTGVPSKATICRVDFKIKYAHFKTQKYSAYTFLSS